MSVQLQEFVKVLFWFCIAAAIPHGSRATSPAHRISPSARPPASANFVEEPALLPPPDDPISDPDVVSGVQTHSVPSQTGGGETDSRRYLSGGGLLVNGEQGVPEVIAQSTDITSSTDRVDKDNSARGESLEKPVVHQDWAVTESAEGRSQGPVPVAGVDGLESARSKKESEAGVVAQTLRNIAAAAAGRTGALRSTSSTNNDGVTAASAELVSNQKMAAKGTIGSLGDVAPQSNPTIVVQFPPPGYDTRYPPEPWPLKVKIRWELMHLYSLNDDDGEAQMTTMVYMLWDDPRLKYNEEVLNGLRMIETPCSNLWYPELEITTIKNFYIMQNRCRVFPSGLVLSKTQMRIEMHAGHNLAMFPFDGFAMTIFYEVETFNAQYVQLVTSSDWKPFYQKPIEKSFVYSLGHFSGEEVDESLLKPETHHWMVDGVSGRTGLATHASGEWARVIVSIDLHRSSAYYIFAHYIPIMIVTFSSATTFLISPEDHVGRIGVFAGSVLALIGINYVMVAEIPKSAHVLWINILLAGEYCLVGFSLILALFGSRKFEQAKGELEETVSLLDDNEGISKTVNNGVKSLHRTVGRRCFWCLSCFPSRFSAIKQSAWWDLVCVVIFATTFVIFHVMMFVSGIYANELGLSSLASLLHK